MKKIFLLAILVIVTIIASSCKKEEPEVVDNGKRIIKVDIYSEYAIVGMNIGYPLVDTISYNHRIYSLNTTKGTVVDIQILEAYNDYCTAIYLVVDDNGNQLVKENIALSEEQHMTTITRVIP